MRVLLVGYVCRACVLGACKPLTGVWAMKKPAAAAVSCVQMSKDKQGHKTRTTRRSRVGASSWVQKCKQLFCLLLECSECSGQGFLAFGFEPPTWSKVHGEGLAK